MYTHVSVLQILLKNMSVAWWSGCRDLYVQTGCIFLIRVSLLETKQTVTGKMPPHWVNSDARYMYYTVRANPASQSGDLATLARRLHVCKSLVSYPWDMDAFVVILLARRENVHANFHCGVLFDLHILL